MARKWTKDFIVDWFGLAQLKCSNCTIIKITDHKFLACEFRWILVEAKETVGNQSEHYYPENAYKSRPNGLWAR